MPDEKMGPTKVFAARLKETRTARGGMTQAELAQRMTDEGRPISRGALLRLENGERGLSLDEALALATLLYAAPAHLLSPPDGQMVWLTNNRGVDGEALRNWLMYGAPFIGMAAAVAVDSDQEQLALRAQLERELSRYALALTDAVRGEDKAGIRAAGEAIVRAVRDYQEAIERREQSDG
jgi:transcriptional regulator with XRE-family HTH domain